MTFSYKKRGETLKALGGAAMIPVGGILIATGKVASEIMGAAFIIYGAKPIITLGGSIAAQALQKLKRD